MDSNLGMTKEFRDLVVVFLAHASLPTTSCSICQITCWIICEESCPMLYIPKGTLWSLSRNWLVWNAFWLNWIQFESNNFAEPNYFWISNFFGPIWLNLVTIATLHFQFFASMDCQGCLYCSLLLGFGCSSLYLSLLAGIWIWDIFMTSAPTCH
jgi:hypothetical protein